MFFNRVVIIGVGLMGASFAQALRRRGLCKVLCGWSRNAERLERARDRGIIDLSGRDLSDLCTDADLILLATPVGAFEDIVSRIRGSLKRGALVTDVGSVKGSLVYALESLMPDGSHYVGSHPIAGSERSGSNFADADLFHHNKCIITPTNRSDDAAVETIRKLWESLGAEVVAMSPEEHDRIFAAVSHLPHLLAYELVNTAHATGESYLGYAGRGFRDMTRIASSSPELWGDICIHNRENLVALIDVLIHRLGRMKGYLGSGNAGTIETEFRKAKLLRDRLEHD